MSVSYAAIHGRVSQEEGTANTASLAWEQCGMFKNQQKRQYDWSTVSERREGD